jgi:preprotein translocase subunit SecF
VFSYSIDFTGGTQIQLHFEDAIDSEKIQQAVAELVQGDVVIRHIGEHDFIIRVQQFFDDAQQFGQRVTEKIQMTTGKRPTLLQSESVGASVGDTLRWKSVKAILLSLVAILFYMAIRFWSFSFSIGAVVALLHDPLIVLAVFLFLDRPISVNMIGAIVAVIGYSINDTIVVFSRIREYLHQHQGSSLAEVVNLAINKTLRRTLLTSFATTLPLVIMFFFGGEALYDFSLALLVGIVFGTYSSIVIASPIMMFFYPWEYERA